MLILTYKEYMAMSKGAREIADLNGVAHLPAKTDIVAMATRLPLGTAIRAVAAYEQALKANVYLSEFTLLSVASVDDLSDDVIRLAGMRIIEELIPLVP